MSIIDEVKGRDDITSWNFYLLEHDDLPQASLFTMDCFYKPRIKLDTSGMFSIERFFWDSIMNGYKAIERFDFRYSNFIGIKSRSGKRLRRPDLAYTTDSFVLVAVRAAQDTGDLSSTEIAGMVEISMESPDGKLPPAIKGVVTKTIPEDSYAPYLCNLCVSEACRRMGLGALLCDVSEAIVRVCWGKDIMYLHVEEDNDSAIKLYEKQGYEIAERKMSYTEMRMTGADKLRYYAKTFTLEPIERDGKGEGAELRGADLGVVEAAAMSAEQLPSLTQVMLQ